jgi:hypothetical protein
VLRCWSGAPKSALCVSAVKSRGVFDRNDAQGVIGVLVAKREIFAGREAVGSKTIAGLVIVGAVPIIIEDPTGVLATAGLMHQNPDLVLLSAPESPNPALIAMRFPKAGIDVPVSVERRDEFIAMRVGTRWKILGASKVETDAFEGMWQ